VGQEIHLAAKKKRREVVTSSASANQTWMIDMEQYSAKPEKH
jgi:hypothetical protein